MKELKEGAVYEKSLRAQPVPSVRLGVKAGPRFSVISEDQKGYEQRQPGVQCRLPGIPKRKSWIKVHPLKYDAIIGCDVPLLLPRMSRRVKRSH